MSWFLIPLRSPPVRTLTLGPFVMSCFTLGLVVMLGASPGPVEPTDAQVEAWLLELRGAPAPNNHLRIKSRAAPLPRAKGDVREVYAKVAPGTVLIRTGRGFGTGIVINTKGYILTNHHVIAPAQVIDFKQQVAVELGRIDEDGLMEKEGKPRIAWVLKSDPLIDLAVIKLEDAVADLKPVKIAEKDPVPGEPVSALETEASACCGRSKTARSRASASWRRTWRCWSDPSARSAAIPRWRTRARSRG